MGEFFDGDILGYIVVEAQVAVGANEGVFNLLEVADGLIDFVDRCLELNSQSVRGARD